MRLPRVVLLAACLLAAAPALAAGLFGGPPEPGQMPTRFIRVEVSGSGFSFPFGLTGELLKATLVAGRLRVGTSAAEGYTWNGMTGGAVAYLPVRVGLTLFTAPRKTLCFYSMSPDVHAEVAAAFLTMGMVPFVRGSLYAGIEGYGVGIGLEAGVMSLGWGVGDWHEHSFERMTYPYVALRLKFLTFGIGF
jgi:hypothetical protein